MSEFSIKPTPKTILQDLSRDELRKLAKKDERTTEFKSASYTSKLKSRSADFTRNTVSRQITKEDQEVIREIREYLKTK